MPWKTTVMVVLLLLVISGSPSMETELGGMAQDGQETTSYEGDRGTIPVLTGFYIIGGIMGVLIILILLHEYRK